MYRGAVGPEMALGLSLRIMGTDSLSDLGGDMRVAFAGGS